MKKLSLIIITVFCCIFYSCNTDCTEVTLSQSIQDTPSDTGLIKNQNFTIQDTPSDTGLIKKLEFYNKTLKKENATTRGNWGGRLWAIVAVDAGSAISVYILI